MTERLYYADSFLTTFAANVADIRLVSRTGQEALWQVALDRTAFYPTSGGQPFDTGVLLAASRSGATLEVPVLEVEEDEHGEVWHTTQKPLSAATEVQGTIDWSRRLDHMQQHTGQHLLSAVFAAEVKAQTVSFHLGDDDCTIDLATEAISVTTLERIERRVNELIFEDRSVRARTVDREQAEGLLAAGKLRKLPEREGTIRLIEIDDCDLNACGGTHVRSTGQIGGLLLRSTEKVRQGVRVEFVCGLRAVTAARKDHAVLGRAAIALSLGRDGVPEAVERLLAEGKAAAKERQKLREELAEFEAAKLTADAATAGDGAGAVIVERIFADRDAAYVKLLASRIASSGSRTVAVLASTHQDPAAVVMACSKGFGLSCGEVLKAELLKLGLRGGGSNDMAQGQVAREQVGPLLKALTRVAHTQKG